MIEDSDIDGVEYGFEEATEVQAPVQKKRPSKARRLVSVALLALLLIIGVVVLTPGLQQEFLPKPRAASTSAPAKSSVPDEEPGPLPPVPVLWEGVDVGGMSADIAQDLRLGKYYYDRKLPGNFGLAIHHWKQALAHTEGGAHSTLEALVVSAERELARQYSADSEDVRVFLKQGRRREAVLLLEKMRANYLDIESPQYVWASVILSRYRR